MALLKYFVFALFFWTGAVLAADDKAPAPQLGQQMRDPLLEQLQMQMREAEPRATEAEWTCNGFVPVA